MSLQNFVSRLEENEQIELAIKLIEHAMPIWLKFADKQQNLEYAISAIGVLEEVDRHILSRSISAARKELISPGCVNEDISNLRRDFIGHNAGIRDEDWIVPREVELVFYSTFNLIDFISDRTKIIKGESPIYISINQSGDAIMKTDLLSEKDFVEFLNEFWETGN